MAAGTASPQLREYSNPCGIFTPKKHGDAKSVGPGASVAPSLAFPKEFSL
jgi:hypothetical protein